MQELRSVEIHEGVLRQDRWAREHDPSSGSGSTGYGLTAVWEGGTLLEKVRIRTDPVRAI